LLYLYQRVRNWTCFKEQFLHSVADIYSQFTYPAFFSSRGPAGFFSMKPEIMAEGDLVPALSPYGSYLVSGTSFSTPQVTGAIALLMQEHPSLLPVQYYSMLTLSAEKMYRWNESYPSYVEGAGEINITKALNMQFALERQDYEMIYPFSNGYYNDTIVFTFFMPGLNYSLSYQGIFPARLNQTYISSNHHICFDKCIDAEKYPQPSDI